MHMKKRGQLSCYSGGVLCIMHFPPALGLTVSFLVMTGLARPQNPNAVANLTAPEIVEHMLHHNHTQADRLKHYQELRHYQVQYKGFAVNLVGKMDVAVTYDATSGKSFHIVSQSGSKLLCDKVLKKAVDSEAEAANDQAATALTPANYKFQLTGSESLAGRPTYVLNVDPITASKFLYRGKVWIDATEFAVVKVVAEPAKNPSFWIQRPQISYTSAKTGEFWLPEFNRSETKVRVGGTAVFTIDYGKYEVDPAPSAYTATR